MEASGRRSPALCGSGGIALTAVFIFRKSTFFNVLTKSQAAAENFPFCTIDPNESRVPIPDERYDFLCQFHQPARYGVTSFTHYSHLAAAAAAAASREPRAFDAPEKRRAILLTCGCLLGVRFDYCSAARWLLVEVKEAEAAQPSTSGYHTQLQRQLKKRRKKKSLNSKIFSARRTNCL